MTICAADRMGRRPSEDIKRRSIAARYAALVAALLAVALIVSGALGIWSSHRDRQASAESLQRDNARAAAVAVARFLEDVQRSLQWATLSVPIAGGESSEQRHLEFIKLARYSSRPQQTSHSV